MEENTQLPKEVVERIELEAKQYAFYNYVTAANGADFTNIETWPQYAQVAYYSIRHYMIGDLTCWPYLEKTIPVEYATKLHQLQRATIESDKQRKEANDQLREAKKLLDEVFRKHETGLLPDRFIYEKIKTFLYGK